MKNSMLKKFAARVATSFVVLISAFAAQAAELFTATPPYVTMVVGETKPVTLVSAYSDGDVTLLTGSNDNAGKVASRTFEYFTATYPDGIKLLKNGTLKLNITGTAVTPEPQVLTIYKDAKVYSTITVQVQPKTVEYEGRTIGYSGASVMTNERGEMVFFFTDNGVLELPENALVDYLVVGGGGAGGRSGSKDAGKFGNSGNGGEVKAQEFVPLSGGTYSIRVGAGGVAPDKGKAGNDGETSTLAGGALSVTAAGGKGGAASGNLAGSPETGTTNDITGTAVVYGQGGATPTKPATQEPSERGAPQTGNGGVGGGADYPAGAGGSGVVVVCVHTMKNQFAGDAQTVEVSRTITIPVDARWGEDWTVRLGGAALATVGQSAAGATVTGVALGETKVFVENGTDVFIYPVTVVKLNQTENVRLNPLEGETELGAIAGEVISVTVSDPSVATAEVKDGRLHATALKGGPTQIVVETDLATYTYSVMADQVIDKTIDLLKGGSTQSVYSHTFETIERIEGDGAGVVAVSQDGTTVTFTVVEVGEANVRVHGQVDGGRNSVLNYTVRVKEIDAEIVPFGDTFVMYSGAAEIKHVDDDLVLVYTNVMKAGMFRIPAPYVATVDILAVGGGGGGGSTVSFGQGGGGGGAGGYSMVEGKKLSVGTFTVQVGAGGSAGASANAGLAARGANGGVSLVTNGVGYVYASARGGGGGATVLDAFAAEGLNGGSGGGSVWFGGHCAAPGSGYSGQGTSGGAPARAGLGGGGGGAGGVGGRVAEVGAGCLGGVGKESGITGETVLYSQGGMGGRSDTQKLAESVAGVGFGGNGGNGGPGTDGADGIVIVRITDMVRNIKVPIPTTNDILRTDYIWKEGETYAGLVYDETTEFRSSTDAHLYRWADVIESVTGVTTTNCTLSATEIDPEDGDALKLGVGYHNFTIHLKSGYTWEDDGGSESYGRTGTLSFRWSIAKEDTLALAAIDVGKFVSWADASNATVTITTYSTPESSQKRRDGVLVLGSLCHSHGFESNVFNQATKAIAEMSDVDYYWWYADATVQKHADGIYRGNTNADGTAISGHLDKGETYEYPWHLLGNEHCIGGQHGCLLYFLDKLDQVRLAEQNGGKKYGYIVFSFDGKILSDNRYQSQQAELLGTSLPHPHEREIAEWLAENFYKEDSVIWLTADGENGLSDGTKPGSGTSSLISILDPYVYLNGGTARSATVQYPDSEYWTIATTNNKGLVSYTYNIYKDQVYYGDADNVASFLKSKIKVKPYNMTLTDTIVSPEKGLTIKKVTVMACTNGVARVASTNEADWVDLISWERATGETTFPANPEGETWGIPDATLAVDLASNVIQSVIRHVDYGVWTRVKIDVEDDGRFRRSTDAVFNEMTGLWEKNPNDGKAFAEMSGTDGVALRVYGDAETQVPWSFQAYPVKVTVYNGDGSVDGLDATEASVGEGLGSTVYYRGDGGYRLTKIIVDGVTVIEGAALEDFSHAYTFNDINEPHEVEVFYEPFFGTVESAPVTNQYDNAVHLIDVKLEGWDESVPNEVRYARWEDRDDVTKYYTAEEFVARYGSLSAAYDPDEPTDVGDHEIAYRVFVFQKGYGKSWDEEGWTWVESETWQAAGADYGSDHSVILPAPLVVRPGYHKPIAVDEAFPELGVQIKGLLDGETLGDVIGGDAMNGWHVASNYRQGDGEGLYPTWVVDEEGARIVTGDPSQIDPSQHAGNFGNYYLLPQDNFQAVVRIPIEIGNVPQGPGLDPEKPGMDTGVDPVIKMYDGISTGLVVEVTSKFPVTDKPLVEDRDYTIEWAIGDLSDPATPPPGGITQEDEPTFLHVGTNVVWYYVHTTPDSEAAGLYFAASNYQYVIITPRPLVIESPTETWTYDGTAHAAPSAAVVEGSLVNGDTLGADRFATITNVGTTGNTFDYAITSGDPGFTGNAADDYDITVRTGKLTVTPAHYTIGEVPYDDPSNTPPYGKDPETGKPLNGVEDAYRVYDGIPTNIVVNVTMPSDPELYDIYYSYTTDGETRTEWTTELPLFTNVVDATVYFKVVPKGEAEGNYIPAENFARVQVVPAEVVVKADDKYIQVDDPQPPYTATIGEVVPGNEIVHDTPTCPTYENAVGEYPIEVTGVVTQGNYVVSYEPGTLHIVDRGLVTTPEPVEKTYDGVPTNITVEVQNVVGDPITNDVTITYFYDPSNPQDPGDIPPDAEWTTDLTFTDVGISNKVWYVVEVPGYDPVTNSAYVTIHPREIVVTADDKSKLPGAADPTLTWTVTDGTNAQGVVVGILPGEEDLVRAAVSNDVNHAISRTPGEAVTTAENPPYPITVGGSENLGNYHVTYVPGRFSILAIYSSNIHGLLKICSPFASTIIPAPWKGYTRDGAPTLDIPVDRMVKPRNLTDGDLLLQYANGGVYKAWTLEKDDATGEGVWTPMNTVAQAPEIVGGATNVVESLYVKPTGGETQKRGYGLWLVRQNPKDAAGNVIPFYLYGQWMTGAETVTIGGIDENDVAINYAGSQYGVAHDTMLADPDCTRASDINHHAWTGFDTADTIILNTDTLNRTYCFRNSRPKRAGGGWYDGWWVWRDQSYTTNGISTPPGVGFWYERRAAGNMTLTWEGAPQYPGEGRDLDVWLVDHADAGDGKTHLAFKLVGPCAPTTIDRASIKALFDAGCIRYLHATGETQAAGKQMMDELSADLVKNARPVPYLRNGTGVNTEEELAKGWIWVTIDATDGTNAADSEKDGTGDTNGAGDLWRIVVGKGVWAPYTVR